MKLIPLCKLFDIYYGTDKELNTLNQDIREIRFVSRTRKNNGISAYVKREDDIQSNPANSISVALGSSSVLYAFLQDEPYYSGRDVAYLVPKKNYSFTKQELLFYCMCITANRYRYNYGRQANKTIKDLLLPDYNEIPDYVNKSNILDLSKIDEPLKNTSFDVTKISYDDFRFDRIFIPIVEEIQSDEKVVNLVSAKTTDNGVKEKIITNTYIEGNNISITTNGINTATAFYQEQPFVTQDCVAYKLKGHKLNKFIAIYLITVINANHDKFNYGRKSGRNRLEKLVLRLPKTKAGKPNYYVMESYIKSLHYSKNL